MTANRAPDRPGVLLLGDSLGGLSTHVAAALRKQLVARHGSAGVTYVDIFSQYLPALGVLARLAYVQDDAFIPALIGSFGEAMSANSANPVVQALHGGGMEAVRELVRSRPFQAVVATSPVAAAAVAEMDSGLRPPLVLVLAAFSVRCQWIHPGCDLYFVATKEVGDELVMGGIPYSRVVVSGMPSVFEPPGTARAVLRKAAGLGDRFTAVLGGAGHAETDVCAIGSRLAQANIQVVAVPGKQPRANKQLEALARSRPNVAMVPTGGRVSPVALGDIVAVRAGGEVHLHAIGGSVPSVVYNPVARQELHNVDFLVNSGAALVARDEEDVVDKVRFMADHPDRLAQMRASAASMGTNNPARGFADRLMTLVGRG